MTAEQTNDEEFGERAAIREYDGDLPKGTAEFFAEREIEVRKAQDTIRDRKKHARPQENNIAEATVRQPAKTIKELRVEWNRIGKKMRAEKDPTRNRELFNQWTELFGRIIEAKKGV